MKNIMKDMDLYMNDVHDTTKYETKFRKNNRHDMDYEEFRSYRKKEKKFRYHENFN